jgi:hypothetical protein
VSHLGTLEQLNLANVLQRVESHGKTGALVIKQGELRVELYVQQGWLVCIGPARTTLGERLLHAGIISPEALQEAMLALGASEPSETRMALTLMDLGHVTHDDLRIWATREYTRVTQILLTWTDGELYFEEEQRPPTECLIVALAISSLLSSAPSAIAARASSQPIPASAVQEQPKPETPDISSARTLFGAAQFFPETSPQQPVTAPFASSDSSSGPLGSVGSLGSLGSLFDAVEAPVDVGSASYLSQPVQVTTPVPPRRIDTSFMRPEMVMVPTDLSALREQNPQFQITAEQWRVFTRADGRTTLQMACQELGMTPEQVCTIAGELIALHLVQVLPMPDTINELSPTSKNLVTSGLSHGYVTPGYAAATAHPWDVATMMLPTTDALRYLSPSSSVETQSQWGNGGNGATFVPGRGWVVAITQPLQPLSGGLPPMNNRVYVPVGERG